MAIAVALAGLTAISAPVASAAAPEVQAASQVTSGAGDTAIARACQLTVGTPKQVGDRVEATAWYTCKQRGNLTMRLELTSATRHTYRASNSSRMTRTISFAKGKGCHDFQLRVNAAEQSATGVYKDVQIKEGGWKKICG